jgi:DNA-binding winged helix-turn-helix (wHTH) protein
MHGRSTRPHPQVTGQVIGQVTVTNNVTRIDHRPSGHGRTVRFGQFELELSSGELRRAGVRVRLQDQPLRLLAVLLERPGQVVTREELHDRLWKETFVDFDHGLNTAIRKLRTALDDSADDPRFIETLARRGYRFIAPVSWSGEEMPQAQSAVPASPRRTKTIAIAAAAVVVGIAVAALILARSPHTVPAIREVVPLTSLGTVIEAAISPDGRYLAYVTSDNGEQALWLKQISSSNQLQLRPAISGAGYWGLSFHPDGNTIDYFIRSPQAEKDGTDYHFATIGGQPTKRY